MAYAWPMKRISLAGLGPALALGALAGLADVSYEGLRRAWLGRLVFVPEWFWWTAPWVNALMALLVTALALWLLPERFARLRDRVRLGVPLALLALGVLLVVPGLHRAASAVLAAGVGVAGGAFLAGRARRADRAAALSLPLLLLAAPAISALAFGLPRRDMSAEEASRSGLPNVLLIVLDTVRAIELSLYGGRAGTSPEIDALADDGVVFRGASSTAPWTLPSHASLFTGRWAHELSAGLLTPLDETYPTLAEVLRESGYRTGGFVGNLEYTTAETGLARGFETWEDHRWSVRGALRLTRLSRFFVAAARSVRRTRMDQPGRVGAPLINERLLTWLEDGDERPFFAFLNYYDAHAPYYPPEADWREFVGDAARVPLDNSDSLATRPDRVEELLGAYRGAIHHVDEQIGMLLDSLRADGHLANTLVIVTSDHGEEFAEHGILGHGNTLYRPSVHVPLVISWPGHLPEGCQVEVPVSIRDVPATVMELIDEPGSFPGRDLSRLWEAPSEGDWDVPVRTFTERARNQPERFPASRGPLHGVEIWPHRLIVESDPLSVELFDRRTDPLESLDLALDPAAAPALTTLSAALVDIGVPLGMRSGDALPSFRVDTPPSSDCTAD